VLKGATVTGTPILGVFNISTRPLTELIPLSRFPGILPSALYVVRAHSTGCLTKPAQATSPSALLTVSLNVRGFEIFSAFPLSSFGSKKKGRVFTTNLGLLGKMTGAAAIVSSQFESQHNGRVFLDTRLKALGILGKLSQFKPRILETASLILW
jgi:hypothetical protein